MDELVPFHPDPRGQVAVSIAHISKAKMDAERSEIIFLGHAAKALILTSGQSTGNKYCHQGHRRREEKQGEQSSLNCICGKVRAFRVQRPGACVPAARHSSRASIKQVLSIPIAPDTRTGCLDFPSHIFKTDLKSPRCISIPAWPAPLLEDS